MQQLAQSFSDPTLLILGSVALLSIIGTYCQDALVLPGTYLRIYVDLALLIGR